MRNYHSHSVDPLFSREKARTGQLSPAALRHWESSFIPKLSFSETSEHDCYYGIHMHEELEILWLRSGKGRMVFRGGRHIMEPGDAVIIAPNELHAGGAAEGHFSMAMLHIPRALIESLVCPENNNENPLLNLPPIQLINGFFSESLYQYVFAEVPHTRTKSEQVRCIEEVLCRLPCFRQSLRKSKLMVSPDIHPSITRAIKFLNENFTEPVDFYELAKQVGLNRRYFIALFKSTTGVTPYQYQLALRVDFSRHLLMTGQSLSSIAPTSGFADQSHFHRHFKRIYCSSPGSFRERIYPF